MKIVSCDPGRHADAILAIYNEAILNSTALYDYRPRTPQMIEAWFKAKAAGNFPVIGAEDESGTLLGFGTFGKFRDWPAYKYTVEHSVYVEKRFRGRGIGRILLGEVIAAAQARGCHVLIGVIDGLNAPSLALHREFGFVPCATVKEAGFKFGRWLDVEFHQLILPTPSDPVDG
jgi:phosphinothricin acetyltransferase